MYMTGLFRDNYGGAIKFLLGITKKRARCMLGWKRQPTVKNWVQDSDVLDTWFSSALWPFSTMGWPDEASEDYQRYFPTSTLVTGYDIIFFCVSRMIFPKLRVYR